MSVGGVFQIITNSGKQDNMIMNTNVLMERLKEISAEKFLRLKQKNPNLTDNEILNMTQDWMPTLAAIERTHIVFTNSTFKPFVAMAHEYSKTDPRGGRIEFGHSFHFTLPVYGEFVNDSVVYIKLEGFEARNPADKVRYVEYLGHRIFKTTKFKHNELEIDTYTSDRYNIYWQYKLPQNKEQAYLKNIGQEIPKQGYLIADPENDEVREYRYFGDGPQTFKTVQPTLELWIPLLFWFKDVQTSLPNFLLSYGQTNVEIMLENEENLVAYSNNSETTGPVYNPPQIKECSLYTNHIFMMPEVHKIFINNFGMQLIRVTRTHKTTLQNRDDNILLQQLK